MLYAARSIIFLAHCRLSSITQSYARLSTRLFAIKERYKGPWGKFSNRQCDREGVSSIVEGYDDCTNEQAQ